MPPETLDHRERPALQEPQETVVSAEPQVTVDHPEPLVAQEDVVLQDVLDRMVPLAHQDPRESKAQ